MTERIRRKGRYYNVKRDENGRFIRVYPVARPKKIRKEYKLIKSSASFKDHARLQKKKTKVRACKKIYKKNVIERIKLSKVEEVNLRSPLKRKKGVLQIRFKFSKAYKGRIMSVKRTGRSNRLNFPSDNTKAFNQCLQRAIAQNVPFSPDKIEIVSYSYFYWMPLR